MRYIESVVSTQSLIMVERNALVVELSDHRTGGEHDDISYLIHFVFLQRHAATRQFSSHFDGMRLIPGVPTHVYVPNLAVEHSFYVNGAPTMHIPSLVAQSRNSE